MGHLSIALELLGRPCLVVGGGTVARRKVDALLDAGAHVTVVAPHIDPAIGPPAHLTLHTRAFETGDVADATLVFACTDDPTTNAAVARAAQDAGAWVNVADDPDACTFFVSAAVTRGALSISVSTGGASPALGQRIRKDLEKQYGEAYAPFVDTLRRLRSEVIDAESDPQRRRHVFARMAALPCEELYTAGGADAIEQAVRELLTPAEAKE